MPRYHMQIDTRLSPSVFIFCWGEESGWHNRYTFMIRWLEHCKLKLSFNQMHSSLTPSNKFLMFTARIFFRGLHTAWVATFSWKILWMTPRKDRRIVHTYCTRNGSCVGSDIGWSVSVPIQERLVGYRQAERRRRHRFCCLTSLPVFRLSLMLASVAA